MSSTSMNLIDRIDCWGHSYPNRVAHISGSRSLTYGELVCRSDTLAAYIAETLPDDGSPVVVVGHKEPEMLIAFLGAVKAGHPYIPVDTSLPSHRIQQIVALSDASLTLTPGQVAALVEEPRPSPGRTIALADPYYIIFTSGSTGTPKGVVITLGCLTSFLDWLLNEHAFVERGEIFLNQAPFSFDLSVMDLYGSLATGGTLFSITRDEIANPKQLYRTLAASGVTTWVSTPSFAHMCLVERGFDAVMLPQLKRLLFCGELLPSHIAAELLRRFPESAVWNTYGPTEATVATTSVRIDRDVLEQYTPLPVGYPMPGTRILLMDETGKPVADGEQGEIVIAGPNVSPGYLGQPVLTTRAFFMQDGVRAYRTGDWGRFRDGMLFFEGRIDSQIKLHGYRIELGDVEANLRDIPGVRDAVVVPRVRDGHPDSLVAFVILNYHQLERGSELGRTLRTALVERLPVYMIPHRFAFVETFPMNTNGKVDRRRLTELLP